MTDDTTGKCKTCRFWKRSEVDWDYGDCHRYPPVIPATESQIKELDVTFGRSGLSDGMRPETFSHDWCGEYQPKPSSGPTCAPDR